MLKNKLKRVMAVIVPVMIIGTSIPLKGVAAYAEVRDTTVATSTAQVATTSAVSTATSSIASVATSTQTEAATVSVSEATSTEISTTYTDDQGIGYELDNVNKTASVSKGNSSANVNIPEKITANGQEYKVTSIGLFGLSGCSAESITLPNSIITIGNSAFASCTNLTSITIPEGVTTIGYGAFGACYNLKSITIPSSVSEISDGVIYMAFGLDSNLSEINVDPNNKNYSSEDGVLFNKDKTELIFYSKNNSNGDYVIPSGVTTIDSYAFYLSNNLTSLVIPESVININKEAIYVSIKINAIDVDANNKNFSSEDGILFNKDKTKLILYPSEKKQSSYSIPNGVTSIDSYAFTECNNLLSVTIPDGIKSIGNSAFFSCRNLNEIIIPNTVTCIGSTIQDRVNYINDTDSTVMKLPYTGFWDEGEFDKYQSTDGVSFYRTIATGTTVATETVEQATGTTASTATTSQTSKTGDVSVLPVIAMMAIGAVGIKRNVKLKM